LHVAADKAQREHDPLAIERILSTQQIDGLDEAGDANNSVAPRRGPYFFEHAGKLDRVVACLCALTHLVFTARNAVAEEPPVGMRICWRHMRHSIDKAVAQKFGSDPAYHAAGRAVGAKFMFVGMAYIGGLEAPDPAIHMNRRRKLECRQLVLVCGSWREGAGSAEAFRRRVQPII